VVTRGGEGRLTDERLRTWHLGQAARERLCAAVLTLYPDYQDVRPRRPEGGPDGGRDLEAVFRGSDRAFGAVGFKNRTTGSARHKREIRAKFEDDLNAALEEDPELSVFAFFTNVDFTPGELAEMQAIGASRGLSYVDIFHRERIRMALDNDARGWGIRYEYLGIEVPGQTSFSELPRIEFGQARALPVRRLDVLVLPAGALRAPAIGKFAMVLEIGDGVLTRLDEPAVCMSSRSSYVGDFVDESMKPKLLYATEQLAWLPRSQRVFPPRPMLDRAETTTIIRSSLILERGQSLDGFAAMDDFQDAHFRFYLTAPLWSILEGFMFAVNQWAIIALRKEDVAPLQVSSEDAAAIASLGRWPEEISTLFQSLGCIEMLAVAEPGKPFGADGVGGTMKSNFERFLPAKMPPEFVADTLTMYR
jgi:hypothetical protein